MYKIAITGNEFFAKRIVNELKKIQIEANYSSLPRNISNLKSKFRPYAITHFVGSPTVSKDLVKLFFLKLYGKKIVVNWIGYDVRRIKKSRLRKIMGLIGNLFTDVNIATAENLTNDLNKNGIQTRFQPIPVYSIYQLENLPDEKRVAVYLPDNYLNISEFYQGSIVKKLVNAFPEIEFLILKNSGKTFSKPNVKCFEWCGDMEKIYRQVKVVIRLPLEDGTSGTVIEALSMGRYVIASNTLLPYCELIHSYEEAKIALARAIEKTKANEKGSEYVKENFSSQKLSNDLIDIYNSIIDDHMG